MNPNTAYYETHYEELLEQYPEKWVAIYNQKVVGTDSDGRQLLISLKKEGFPLRKVLVKHLTHEGEFDIPDGSEIGTGTGVFDNSTEPQSPAEYEWRIQVKQALTVADRMLADFDDLSVRLSGHVGIIDDLKTLLKSARANGNRNLRSAVLTLYDALHSVHSENMTFDQARTICDSLGQLQAVQWTIKDLQDLDTKLRVAGFETVPSDNFMLENIEVPTGPGKRHEPVIKGKGVPIWPLVAYVQKRGLTPEQVSQIWNGFITSDEVLAALKYQREHPNVVEDHLEGEDMVDVL